MLSKALAFSALALVLAVSSGCAGQLRNTFTAPSLEASITGADTCAAGTVAQSTVMTIRRRWVGPTSGQDSLTSVSPGAACTMTAGVPTGTYLVTIDARDAAGNWSCATTASFLVHGKPARVSDLGAAMLKPARLPELLATLL